MTMTRRRKVLLTAAVAAPLVLGGAGTAYAVSYQDLALPGSSVAGTSVAGMTRDEVAAVVRQRADATRVTIRSGGSDRVESPAALGYTVDVPATVDRVFAGKTWMSFATSLVHGTDVEAVVRTDADTTQDVVDRLVAASGGQAHPAKVALDDTGTSFTVTPAVEGKTISPASLQEVAADAARELTSRTATVQFVDAPPTVTTEAAQAAADRANALVARAVVLDDGDDKHTATAKEKAAWVTIPRTDTGLGTPVLRSAAVQVWVDALAAKAKESPTAGVRNVDASGAVRAVVEDASDGRVVTNAGPVARAVAKTLVAGRDYAGSFAYRTLPATWTERRVAAGAENLAYAAAEGEKWIDVDLGRHTMTAYVGAKVVYGPIAMVNGAAKTPTVTGTFHVYYKNPLMTMRGANADGTNYETPDVPWSSFFFRGFALHGAPWRSSFGYAASHGCINLPVPVAKWVYGFATMGTTVTSHY